MQHAVCDAEKALSSYRVLLHVRRITQIETVLCRWEMCVRAGWWHLRLYLEVTLFKCCNETGYKLVTQHISAVTAALLIVNVTESTTVVKRL